MAHRTIVDTVARALAGLTDDGTVRTTENRYSTTMHVTHKGESITIKVPKPERPRRHEGLYAVTVERAGVTVALGQYGTRARAETAARAFAAEGHTVRITP